MESLLLCVMTHCIYCLPFLISPVIFSQLYVLCYLAVQIPKNHSTARDADRKSATSLILRSWLSGIRQYSEITKTAPINPVMHIHSSSREMVQSKNFLLTSSNNSQSNKAVQ